MLGFWTTSLYTRWPSNDEELAINIQHKPPTQDAPNEHENIADQGIGGQMCTTGTTPQHSESAQPNAPEQECGGEKMDNTGVFEFDDDHERLVALREFSSLIIEEIFEEVLPEKSACFRGMGVVPKPKRSRAIQEAHCERNLKSVRLEKRKIMQLVWNL
ncbi:hypothetical protein FNV43_RR12874 [Rhamnella rubrinervis]|uniref:Uncharacterized protein n=1 Tax=Rhamnella rubrinervis TaxID=2594499 RepID=A0A8K0H064_9ROSA|nr:hypothetical protein FNV43_RR12874 [Rhamnella rubrinervis]